MDPPAPRHPKPRASGALLDPRLYEQQMTIKVEDPVIPAYFPPQPGPVLRQRPLPHYMQYWPTESRASSRTGSYTNPDYETSSEYSDPSERRRYTYSAASSCAIEDDNVDVLLSVTDPMAVSESAKLKGIIWPGMAIFDSATPEMRRKRNQKKDSSVVEQLEINSQEVEAMELIFSPQGSFKRQRRISSSVCDDEEEEIAIKNESPKSLPLRAPLADLEANTFHRLRQPIRSQLSYSLYGGHENEQKTPGFGLTHLDQASKRKRGFGIFQDEEISFAQPAPFNYLTAGLPQQNLPTPMLPNHRAYGSPLVGDNKENIMSMLHQPIYEHVHQYSIPGYHHHHTYSYGLEQDPNTFSYHNPVYNHNTYQQQSVHDDDQNTLTAPPSPSTS